MIFEPSVFRSRKFNKDGYNYTRTHQGKRCQGRTPMETFVEGKKFFEEKNLENLAA